MHVYCFVFHEIWLHFTTELKLSIRIISYKQDIALHVI